MMRTASLLLLAACTSGTNKDSNDSGAGGDLVLAPGFGEATLSGVAAGEEELTTCAGWFPVAPQHTLTLSAVVNGMRVEADTAAVVIRMVFTENGSEFCSDLDTGLPEIVRGSWSAGDYDIYVGIPEEGAGAAYTLTFSE